MTSNLPNFAFYPYSLLGAPVLRPECSIRISDGKEIPPPFEYVADRLREIRPMVRKDFDALTGVSQWCFALKRGASPDLERIKREVDAANASLLHVFRYSAGKDLVWFERVRRALVDLDAPYPSIDERSLIVVTVRSNLFTSCKGSNE
jgi:hypothetical protein